MTGWAEEAVAEITSLKPHWVAKHLWNPRHVIHKADGETGEVSAVDLFVDLQGGRLGDKIYLLRLRYLPDWRQAGRREGFVNPEDPNHEAPEFWPPNGSVRSLNPSHSPPAICLRGVWGYHSVLHTSERPDGTTLLGFLLELQKVIDE